MPLWYGNFDFEHRLGHGGAGSLPRHLLRLNALLAPVWLSLARDGDFLWTGFSWPASFRDHLSRQGLPRIIPVSDLTAVPRDTEVCAWGWDASVTQLAARSGWTVTAPSLQVVRDVNSRRYSFQWEQQLEQSPAGSACLTAGGEIEAALRRLPQPESGWLIKAEFSNSGRERITGNTVELTAAQRAWCVRRLANGQRLYLEPRLNRLAEFGLQWQIPAEGSPELVGVTRSEVDAQGQIRAIHFSPLPEASLLQDLASQCRPVLHDLQQRGYFGPLGLDVMEYVDHANGERRYRWLQDLNARWTMGRLALGWQRYATEKEQGTLHFLRTGDLAARQLRQVLQQDQTVRQCRLIDLTLGTVDGQEAELSMLITFQH